MQQSGFSGEPTLVDSPNTGVNLNNTEVLLELLERHRSLVVPKEDEYPEEGVLRAISEETGIDILEILDAYRGILIEQHGEAEFGNLIRVFNSISDMKLQNFLKTFNAFFKQTPQAKPKDILQRMAFQDSKYWGDEDELIRLYNFAVRYKMITTEEA